MIVTMLSSAQNAAAAYTMKKTMAPHSGDENLQTLQKLSKGVATIAQRANEAIVFVSVYKTVQGMPFDQVDPFEFFFFWFENFSFIFYKRITTDDWRH